MKKYLSIIITALLFFSVGVMSGPLIQSNNTKNNHSISNENLENTTNITSVSSGLEELDQFTEDVLDDRNNAFGYPGNQNLKLHDFYEWYTASGLDQVILNNVGDPFSGNPSPMSTQAFEREVIEFFAPLYDFDLDNVWGIVTHSGTDGNNHGIYFGAKEMLNETGMLPVVYVSDEAHYSNMRLCDLQNLEVKLIKSDEMGRMIPEELDAALDDSRPALIVYAMGSTFKGAIDDIDALNKVIDSHSKIPAVYRHVDAALFGGYLPFTDHKDMVSQKEKCFDSIAISGHKFFGMDSPSGLFLCTRDVYDSQDSFKVTYLNNNMRMINCSRDALQPLKLWWLIHHNGYDNWTEQAKKLLECTAYLDQKLTEIDYPHWVNEYSNTVFFKRPSDEIVNKYLLAAGYDENFGGDLAHIVVMQHVDKDGIDRFIEDLLLEIGSK